MIYVYRRASSSGARLLAEALGGRRIRDLSRVRYSNDLVVCWGEHAVPTPSGPFLLNNAPLSNKLEDALKLAQAGVPTVQVSRTRPVQSPPQPVVDPGVTLWEDLLEQMEDFRGAPYQRDNPVVQEALRHLYRGAQETLTAMLNPLPIPPVEDIGEWLGRSRNHVGGADLLNPPASPDYWVKKENLLREVRVHSFDGRSIRAGVKAPREGVEAPHSWIRSWDGGWRISYDGETVRQRHRDLAARAVAALGLTFGAVDIGETASGDLLVLEVNRAPGLEGGTITAYANAIRRWMEEE